MSSSHKQNIESYLSKIYRREVGEIPKKETSFRIQLKPSRPTLHIGEREIPITKSRELKRVGRIVDYYKHTDYLPREKAAVKDAAESDLETKKSVKELGKAIIPGANGSILAGMRLADDTLSLTRNILHAIPDIGPQDVVMDHLGYYAGIFWTFFSLRELDDGLLEYKRSNTIGDAEGKRRSQARILSGGTILAGSLAYLGEKICDTYASTAVSSAALGVSNTLFGVGSLVAVGASALGMVRCERFNSRLNEYLENPRLSEDQRLKGALRFLKDSISVTSEEKIELRAQIEEKHPEWSLEQKEALFQQKLSDLTEIKVKYMKRRTSNKSLYLIANFADQLIEKLSDKSTCAEGIKEATILINTIQKENRLKMSLYTLGFIAALLSFLGMVLATVMSAGIVPFILYGTAGAIYLALTIYNIAGMILNKSPETTPPIEDFILKTIK